MVEIAELSLDDQIRVFGEEIDRYSNRLVTNIERERAIRRARNCARSILAACIETNDPEVMRVFYQDAINQENPSRASLIYDTFKEVRLTSAQGLRDMLDIPPTAYVRYH